MSLLIKIFHIYRRIVITVFLTLMYGTLGISYIFSRIFGKQFFLKKPLNSTWITYKDSGEPESMY